MWRSKESCRGLATELRKCKQKQVSSFNLRKRQMGLGHGCFTAPNTSHAGSNSVALRLDARCGVKVSSMISAVAL
jgi:hypothetical protein